MGLVRAGTDTPTSLKAVGLSDVLVTLMQPPTTGQGWGHRGGGGGALRYTNMCSPTHMSARGLPGTTKKQHGKLPWALEQPRQWDHGASCTTLTDNEGGSPVLGTVQHHVPTHVLLALQAGGYHRLLRLGQGAEQGDGREGVGDDGGDTSSGPCAGAWVVVSPSGGLDGIV